MTPDDLLEAARALVDAHGARLVRVAAQSIEHALRTGEALTVDLDAQPTALRADGACFVTLTRHGDLRGCIGSVTPHRPLVVDVADNAVGAALRDPRFRPLRRPELEGLTLSISVLSPLAPLPFVDADDLRGKLRPGVDGVMLTGRGARGLFLPSVWDQLPEAADFLRHLKAKAGLRPDDDLVGVHAERFVTVKVDASALPAGERLWTA